MAEQPISAPTPDGASTGLTINDLVLVLQVIQLSTSRGTFKADELSPIGGLYDRIFKFLESVGAISKTGAPTEAPSVEVPPKEPVPKTKKASAPSTKTPRKK